MTRNIHKPNKHTQNDQNQSPKYQKETQNDQIDQTLTQSDPRQK